MEMITIPKVQFERMQVDLQTLRHSSLYKRLMEFEQNILMGGKFTRKDLGF